MEADLVACSQMGTEVVVLCSSRREFKASMPGRYVWEFIGRLHDLAGSWPGEFEFPDRYYSGPEGSVRVRFLVPEDMGDSFCELLSSFAQEKNLPFDPSGAVALARSAV
jgi:hypothetical protein